MDNRLNNMDRLVKILAIMEVNRDTVKPNSTVNKPPNMVKLV